MNDFHECEFVVDGGTEAREYPVAQVTGWEAVIFELQDEATTAAAPPFLGTA
jgi:hypothetical protein